jgi:shikimate kinase
MNAIANPPLPNLNRTIVLIGMPGSGKSSIGKRLAQRLGLPFLDADHEIEAAAGMTIEDIFATYGEAAFRDGERKVIARLLAGPPAVLSTGGGAFMDAATRAAIKARGVSVWLNVAFPVLLERCLRSTTRPLLKKPDPAAALQELLGRREPVYAEADVVALSDENPPEETVERVLAALGAFLDRAERRP